MPASNDRHRRKPRGMQASHMNVIWMAIDTRVGLVMHAVVGHPETATQPSAKVTVIEISELLQYILSSSQARFVTSSKAHVIFKGIVTIV